MDRTKDLTIFQAVLEEHLEEYGLDIVLNHLFDAVLKSKRIKGSKWKRDQALADDLRDFISEYDYNDPLEDNDE